MNTKEQDKLEQEEQGIIGLNGRRYVTDAPGLPEGLTLYKPSEGSGGENNTGSKAGGSYSYAQSAPSYINQYQNTIDRMRNGILNREAFTYDPNTDPMYQQYKDSYTRQGQQAMQDTLAQVSARTGGLASSYAGTAAQQTYNGYMSALADKVPQLRQMAYEMYMDKGDTMRQNLSMLQGLENAEYGRYLDRLGQWNADRQFEYGKEQDAQDQQNYLADVAYRQQRDQQADQQKAQEKEEANQMALAELMADAGDFSSLKDVLGLTDAQVARLEANYRAKNTPKVTVGGGGPSMTLATAKAMAEQGQFTDDVLRTLRDAGFNDEYLKRVYGYGSDVPKAEPEPKGRAYQRIYNQIKGGDFNVSTIAGLIERADLTDEQKDKLLTMIGY
jgi:hypothetical protein